MNRRILWILPLLLLSHHAANSPCPGQIRHLRHRWRSKRAASSINEILDARRNLRLLLRPYPSQAPSTISADARGDLSSNIKSGLVGPRVALHSSPPFPSSPTSKSSAGSPPKHRRQRTSHSQQIPAATTGGLAASTPPSSLASTGASIQLQRRRYHSGQSSPVDPQPASVLRLVVAI